MAAYAPPPNHIYYPHYPAPAPAPAPVHPPTAAAQAAPPVPYHHPAAAGLMPSQDDRVRTLFIAGLPDDVKPREIYNLFREFPGYESSQVKTTGRSSQAFAFAVFSDQQSAVAALHALNGLMFDLEKESTLYIDFAKANSRPKRSRADDGNVWFPDKKVRGSGAYAMGEPDSGVGSNIHLPGMGNSAYSMNGYPPAQSGGKFGIEAVNDINLKFSSNSSTPYASQNSNPCPTLFVANLSPNCTEQGLSQLFSRYPGFLKLKVQNRHGVPVAFVDFQDVATSTSALRLLQGSQQFSLNGEGMRLEYAKTRMGMKKRER